MNLLDENPQTVVERGAAQGWGFEDVTGRHNLNYTGRIQGSSEP
jgi:hypothetical protein